MSFDDLLMVLFCFIPIYALYSMGLYTIGKRRKIPGTWLAWIPMINGVLVGAIADDYTKAKTGKRGKLRWGTGILSALMAGSVTAGLSLLEFTLTGSLVWGAVLLGTLGYAGLNDGGMTVTLVICWVVGIFLLLAFIPISVARLVLTIIARRDLYRSCCPEFAAVCLAAGLLFPFLNPLFVFLMRKQDGGLAEIQAQASPGEMLT